MAGRAQPGALSALDLPFHLDRAWPLAVHEGPRISVRSGRGRRVSRW